MAKHVGTVVWFNNAKGFGFLKPPSGADVFCHYTAIKGDGYKSLKDDDSVEFEIEIGPSGKEQAANVVRLSRE